METSKKKCNFLGTFETDSNWSSLKHKWGTIKKEVSIFQGFHESVERRTESGKTSNNKIIEAKAMFQQLKKMHSIYSTHGTPFSMSQSGQRNENPGTEKLILKLPMVLMKVTQC
jgi:hypothetical protein